ncbi:DUF1028 domain-containing protein [Candidatus Poseidoniales archaeon]|nr:DUF1028 domain-containing protein [Candidatus Poseidoniales archaeon]
MTYSIVARCSQTGQLGVAVQSHWFGAGVVCWAKAGVGAVATQAMALIDHGPLGIELMQEGESAENALRKRLSLDDAPEIRQVAMVDSAAGVAVHTGSQTIPEAGHIVGDGFSCQANMMWNSTVWNAMHDAFINAQGDLAHRMLASLHAAEEQGGDIRGMQAARILVVGPEQLSKPWMETITDIRVDDHPEPLTELSRLLEIQNAYSNLSKYQEGNAIESELSSEIPEIAFWRSVDLVNKGRHEEAKELIKVALEEHPGWEELLIRCAKNNLAGITEETVRTLLER